MKNRLPVVIVTRISIVSFVWDKLRSEILNLFHYFYIATVIDYWKTLRGNYRRAIVKLSKWCKQPSGSGVQKGKKPRPYKYAADLSFLDAVFSFEEMDDSMAKEFSTSDGETNDMVH